MGGKKRQAKDQKAADEKEQLETLGEAAGAYGAYRPQSQQAINAALQQSLSTFSGVNSLLEQMGLSGFGSGDQYGGIISEEMMGVGQTSKSPGFAGKNPFSAVSSSVAAGVGKQQEQERQRTMRGDDYKGPTDENPERFRRGGNKG